LELAQKVPPTPGQPEKAPMPIPLAIGLLAPDGSELPTRLDGEAALRTGTRILTLNKASERFRFVDLEARPVPSLLRGFSAPAKLPGMLLDRLKFLAIQEGIIRSSDGWISVVRPSTRPLRTRLRMRNCVNSTNSIGHGEERRRRGSNHAQHRCSACSANFLTASHAGTQGL
jgi:hypothetical protein